MMLKNWHLLVSLEMIADPSKLFSENSLLLNRVQVRAFSLAVKFGPCAPDSLSSYSKYQEFLLTLIKKQ